MKNKKKMLVTYFSASGVTAGVAKTLSDAIKADIYEIKPQTLYSNADLNWNDKKSRSSIEMEDQALRPAIADKDAGIENYDVIFIGFPIWWYVAPTIINTFLESYDFSGKIIVPFATSGGSGFGRTVQKLKPSVSDSAIFVEGKLLNGRQSKETLAKWISGLTL